jgi:SAM-dependent methyltransferase
MSFTSDSDSFYQENSQGIWVPRIPVSHRDEEYDQAAFDVLLRMQCDHFWYLGRHRFLLRAVRDQLGSLKTGSQQLAAVDLGGGCGGWIKYLQERADGIFAELALADSSLRALELAGPVMGKNAKRYQIDLLRLGWQNRWDVAFLLDVLEHIPQDQEALVHIRDALRPGGWLFVTTPALRFFWSYNDELAKHQRRYSKHDFRRLAAECGLELCSARYFMFFLSPLLLLARWRRPDLERMSEEQVRDLLAKQHAVPLAPINRVLYWIFALETPLGLKCPFPWGTSILGVFRKPS